MGCSFSGLNALYDAVNGGGDVWINENRYRIIRQLGEGGFAFVYLVKEVVAEGSVKKLKDPSHISGHNLGSVSSTNTLICLDSSQKDLKNFGLFPSYLSRLIESVPAFTEFVANFEFLSTDIHSIPELGPGTTLTLSAGFGDNGMYAVKKVLIQTPEQLELVRQEIRVSSLFSHPNLLPLLDHAIIAVKGTQEGSWNHEAYLLFPVHLDGTLLDRAKAMKEKKEFFPTLTVLQIFQQLCAGLKHMHNFEPAYAHNDVKPGNVLITNRKGQPPLAILMDFGSAGPAKREIRSRSEALQLQEWAAEHCSAPYRAPELWDCPSHADIDERTDIWALGCTLYAIMYGMSPFEYALGESGGSLQLAIVNGQIKWPPGPNPPYPDALHQFVIWMLQPQVAMRPHIEDVIIHVDKLLAKYST